jgi:hypothetical protein
MKTTISDATIGYDKHGYDIIVGDMVVYGRRLYQVTRIKYNASEQRNKLLELMHHQELTIQIVEARQVLVCE